MNTKWAATSKTAIVNLLSTLLAVGSLLANNADLWAWVSAHPKVLGYVVTAGATINLILRFLTTGAVSLTRPGVPPVAPADKPGEE